MGHGREKQQHWSCGPPLCPQDCEGLRKQQKQFQFIYKPRAIFSSLIPGGALPGSRLEAKAGESVIILLVEQVLPSSLYLPASGSLSAICRGRKERLGQRREGIKARTGS